VLSPAMTLGADPAPNKPAAVKPVKLEAVEGSTIKRVILTQKAVDRLGIKTDAKVREEEIPHIQTVGGLVLDTPVAMAIAERGLSGGGAALTPVAATHAADADASSANMPLMVMVTVSPGEFDRMAQDRPARLIPLNANGGASTALMAMPSKLPPVPDPKRLMLALYYTVGATGQGLTHMERVRVDLELSDHGVRRSVVPTSSIVYDEKGGPWVYVNTAPLTYFRQAVGLERIAEDRAILSSGPPVGATVVTVGASMLYGSEKLGK